MVNCKENHLNDFLVLEFWRTKLILNILYCPFNFYVSLLLKEIIFYKVIDYILHGKEDIKVIPWVFDFACLFYVASLVNINNWSSSFSL